MRKGVKGLLMLCVILITFSIFCLDAKAAKRAEIIITKLTQTSVDFDYSETLNEKMKEANGKGFLPRRVPLKSLTVKCYEITSTVNETLIYENNLPDSFKDSITNLKPGKKYWIKVIYQLANENFERTLYRTFITPKDNKSYAIKQVGCTDTSITIDMREAYESLEKDLKQRDLGVYYNNYMPYIGFAKKGSNNAKAEAWDMAVNGNNLIEKFAYYTIKGLDPSSHYSVCVMLRYKVNGSLDEYMDYFLIDDVYTAPKGNYENLTTIHEYSDNGKVDTYMIQKKSVSMYSADISANSTENSITLNWSKMTGDRALTGVKIGYALCTNVDLDKDLEENGKVDAVTPKASGPYYRKAFKMCDGKDAIVVSDSTKSCTLKNLNPGSYYAVAIRYTHNNDDYYMYGQIHTQGEIFSGKEYLKNASENNKYVLPCMYDAKTHKEGKNTIVDWTEALNSFLSQEFWKSLNARPSQDSISYIGYEEATVNSYDRTENYNSQPNTNWTKNIAAEPCATKARIFGLDPNKKYVFCIRTNVTYFYNGDKNEATVVFYADETGTNYVKLRHTGEDIASREYRAKVAVLKNRGVLNVDISNGEFTLTGSEAKEVFDTLKLANSKGFKPQVSGGGSNIDKGEFYRYDLDSVSGGDVRIYYSYEDTYDKCKVMFDKDPYKFSIKEQNISILFEDAFLTLLKEYAADNKWTGYYTGINFIFENPNKTDSKQDAKKDDSSKPSNSSSDNSSKKSDSQSKKEKTGNSSSTDSNVKKNKTITYKGYKYEIISSSAVRLVAPTKKSIKTVNVPAKIKYAKKTYKVTEIGDSAFKNCKKLKMVSISANVKVIGKKAFYGCKKLKSVEIKSKNIKKVGKKAFDRTSKELKISVPKQKYKKYKGVLKKAGLKAGKIKQSKK